MARLIPALALALACCGPDAPGDAAPGGDADAEVDAEIDADAEVDADADPEPATACDGLAEARVEPAGELAAGRYAPAGVVLGDGRALVAGGYDLAEGIQLSAELFDPATGALSPSGELGMPRNFPATLLLDDGAALLVGGFNPVAGSLTSAELFLPDEERFEFLDAFLEEGREAHTATRLPGGAVLVAGGLQARGFSFHDTAEIFDPTTRTFSPTNGALGSRRAFHAAASLSTGEVLLAGGDSGAGALASLELYDPATGRFRDAGPALPRPASALAAAPLPDGRVLIVGGSNAADGTLADADLYDPATGELAPAAPMATRRMAHTLTVLRDGRVLAAGGWSDSTSPAATTDVLEVYDPAADEWETLPATLAESRHDHVALLLRDCRVLLAGGKQAATGGAESSPRAAELVTVPSR